MKNVSLWFGAVKKYAVAHKILSGIALLVVLVGGWYAYGALTSTSGQVSYVLGSVATNTIVSSISESGQISASDQLSITPQVSGEILAVGVKPGQQVRAGQLIAEIDPTTALQAVTSAKENLQSAELSLQKLQEPATTLTLTQQQNNISQAQQNLTTLYQSSYSDIINTFVDLPTIISGVQDVNLGNEAGGASQWNIDYYLNQVSKYSTEATVYRDNSYNDYNTARASYDKTFSDYKSLPSIPDQATITRMLKETYNTVGAVANAVKSANNLVQFYSDQLSENGATPKPIATTQIANLTSYLSKAQAHINTLLADTNSLQSDQQTILINQQTLAQTQAGTDPIDLQSAQLSVQRAQDALNQANTTLAEYYVTAPFAGTVASVPVNKYDQASGGTVLATLVTNQQYADLSLNEVDAAKIQLGNKVTITFNAIPSLTQTGTVAQINPVGTVAQGVVTYDVKVALDTQDARVKTGMSINATIQTAVAINTLTVPSSAVKTTNGSSYVLVFDPPLATSTPSTASGQAAQGVVSTIAPQSVPVTIGISDNTNTQILSGLTAGEQIVVRTITSTSATTKTAAATATSRTGAAGGGIGGGGGGGAPAIRL